MANRSAGINIRTLGDQRREADQNTELYNGNQVSNEVARHESNSD